MIKRVSHKHVEDSELYSVKDVCEMTGYHANTIRKHIRSGKLVFVGLPGKKLLTGDEVKAFLRFHVNG